MRGYANLRRATSPLALAACLGAAACAPYRPAPGMLAPPARRTTNEVQRADLLVIDAVADRRTALARESVGYAPRRAVALARAGAWIAFAREVYLARPRSGDADAALAEAAALMAPFGGAVGQTPRAARTTLASLADSANPDLWADVDRLAARPDSVADPVALADAEIELVRIGSTPGCAAPQLRAHALRLLTVADALQSALARDSAIVTRLADDERLRGRIVHFALASDSLGMPSAALLERTLDAMRRYPELQLAIIGHADPRGGSLDNLVLSGRRARRVRDLLSLGGVADNRMIVRMMGANAPTEGTGSAASLLDYARDRRVQLSFRLADGTEVPVVEDGSEQALDLQIERSRAARPPARRRHP